MRLDEFLPQFRENDNEWWRLAAGDQQNMFEAAIDQLDEARAENERLRQQAVINDPEGAWDRETARLNAEIERLERAVVSAVEARNSLAEEVAQLRPTLDDPEAPAHFPTLMRERDEARAALDRVRALCDGAGRVQGPFGQPYEAVSVTALRAALDGDEDCTCGYGGFHEPENPRCARNQGGEQS